MSYFDTILCNGQGPLRGIWVGEGGILIGFAKVPFQSNFYTILCNGQGPLRRVWVGEGGRAAAASLQHLHQPPARFSSGG